MAKVLILSPTFLKFLPQCQSTLEQNGIALTTIEPTKTFDVLALSNDFDGIVAGSRHCFDRRTLEKAAPRLKILARWGVGLDNIDTDAARELGIPVFCAADNRQAVAEVAMGYILMLARQLHHIDQAARNGHWYQPEGIGLQEAVIGIIGLGTIGQQLAHLAAPFGMHVLAHDIQRINTDIKQVSLPELLSKADYICLTCNLTEHNRGMIGPTELKQMKRGAYLINVARGALVNETALLNALQEHHLAGAALDVYETEPLPGAHPFASMKQVILGSHNAGNTRQANAHALRQIVDQLIYVLGDIKEP